MVDTTKVQLIQKKSKIVVVVDSIGDADETNVAATIAHEFRHHIQHLNGNTLPSVFEITTSYEQAIHDYFHKYWWEMDALLFEYKVSKSPLNDWWLNKLVKENCDKGVVAHDRFIS